MCNETKPNLILGEEIPRHYFPRKGPDKEAALVRGKIMTKAADSLLNMLNRKEADFREVPDDLMQAYEDLIIRMHVLAKYEKRIALED